MKIGELAKASGLPASTIRFYESEGLLPPSPRGANGYRLYGLDALERIKLIQLAQRVGLPVKTMRSLKDDVDGWQKEAILQHFSTRLAEVKALRQALGRQQKELELMLGLLNENWAAGQCVALDDLLGQLNALHPADKAG